MIVTRPSAPAIPTDPARPSPGRTPPPAPRSQAERESRRGSARLGRPPCRRPRACPRYLLRTAGARSPTSLDDLDGPAVTVDAYPLAGADPLGRVAGADHGRHAVLSRDDRRV